MRRVAVVGCSGAGKTTFARALAGRLSCAHVELDALHWEPGWRMADLEVCRARVAAATDAEAWVCDGSYGKVRPIVWGRADTLVWLDFSLPVVLARLARRTATRVWTREELWNGNREVLRDHLRPSKDNLFVWAVRQHPRHRREYPAALTEPAYAHLRLVRLRSPREADAWLQRAGAVAP